MIRFRGIEFSYDGRTPALAIPSLDIGAGLTIVVGPNGAGKSTLLRIVAGVERPTAGTITIEDLDLWHAEAEARRHLAYVPEHPELTPYASIADVLQLVARLRGAPRSSAADALDRVGLLESAWHTVRELSMGQRRRALFATALIGDPRVIVLDEPLETMDHAMRDLICDWVRERRSAGAAILIATHDLQPFAADVDTAIVVRQGAARVADPLELGPVGDRLAHLEKLAAGSGVSA
jgi:ABC-2 type transport system ATP-binding protein